MTHLDTTTTYPRLIRRVKALMIDGLMIPVMAMAVLIAMSKVGFSSEYSTAAAILSVFLLEPFLVTTTAGTVGHHLLGIKVVNSKTMLPLGIVRATLRFITKTTLGLFSLVVVLTSRRHQALHDYLSSSIVIIKNPLLLPEHECLKERDVEEKGYDYPSKKLRVLIISLYLIVLFLAYVFLLVFILTEDCLNNNVCSSNDIAVAITSQTLWLVGSLMLVVFGWRSQLWGCRRKRISTSEV